MQLWNSSKTTLERVEYSKMWNCTHNSQTVKGSNFRQIFSVFEAFFFSLELSLLLGQATVHVQRSPVIINKILSSPRQQMQGICTKCVVSTLSYLQNLSIICTQSRQNMATAHINIVNEKLSHRINSNLNINHTEIDLA